MIWLTHFSPDGVDGLGWIGRGWAGLGWAGRVLAGLGLGLGLVAFYWKSERDYKEGTHPCQCDDRVSGFDDDRAANRQARLASRLASKSEYLF